MCVIAHRFNFKFDKYDILLCGAYSRISPKKAGSGSGSKQVKYELYMPSNEDRYNQGLVLVLDAVRTLTQYVDQNHGHIVQELLPPDRLKSLRMQNSRLEIQGDLIGRVSFKYNSGNLPEWTKACKYFLTKLQYLILLSVLRDQNE